MDVGAIYRGWKNLLMKENIPQSIKDEALRRSQICASCEWLGTEDYIARGIGAIESMLGIKEGEVLKKGSRCTKCGCGLHAKVMDTNSQCPIGKWSNLNELNQTLK
jgi:predicted Zn-ribbon and HTH transcriptional regulator